jgi:pyrroline-5-carboxylate reductase
MHELIGFLGGGNMAGGLIGGLRASGHPGERIVVVEVDPARRRGLVERHGVRTGDAGALGEADVVILAVKPQQLRAAVSELHLRADTTVISIAAGIACDSLRTWLGGHGQIVRTMPNSPAMVGAGAAGLFAPPQTGARAREHAQTLLGCVGVTAWVEKESLLDAVTALSGSGPAYFFLLTEAMQGAGVALGLSPEAAERLARQTLIGAGRLAQTASEPVAVLRAQVTSPGGTTFAAVSQLESAGFHPIVAQAMDAAACRSRELGEAARNAAH